MKTRNLVLGVATVAATVASLASVTPAAAASRTTSPSTAECSTAPPSTSPAGWKLDYAEGFSINRATGSFGPTWDNVPAEHLGKLHVYENGWPDTSGKVNGTPSIYEPTTVLSVANGCLVKTLYNKGKGARSAAVVVGGAQLGGRYAVRFRSEAVLGFKTAWLLWPQSEVWPRDGEIDFPEGRLNSTMWGFMHHQDATTGSDQESVALSTPYTSWHTAVVEWIPGKRCTLLLDDVVVANWTTRVPSTPMTWVLQTESNIDGPQPPTGTSGKLYIDWVARWSIA